MKQLQSFLIILMFNLSALGKSAPKIETVRTWKIHPNEPQSNFTLILIIIIALPIFLYVIYKLDEYQEKKQREAREKESQKTNQTTKTE